jgi:hypothetical protein
MKSEQIINDNEINTDSKVKKEQVENNNENEINTDSKPKIINEEKEIKNEKEMKNEKENKNENENEINTDSKKKSNKNQNQKPKQKQNKQNKKKINKTQSNIKSIFDDFFDFPLRISNILKDLSIREKFEEEKRLSVPNLREFFEMSQKKKSKWDNIPVTNIQKFFELCEKTPLNQKKEEVKNTKKNAIKEISKSYISKTFYKNGHRIDERKQIIKNENGEEEIISEKLVDGKGKKIISKNGKNKVIKEEQKLLPQIIFTQRYNPIHNIFNDFGLFEMRPRKMNNGFIRNFLPMGLLL